MNQRQALSLAIGLLAGIGILLYPWPHTRVRLASTQTLPSGEIVRTYRSQTSLWPLASLAAVAALTGLAVYRFRIRDRD
ncbi:MAG: hypothetical protein JO250_06165 [Armatimonadetes bacterium]|nr:hypothetical protein [Armatimonadota bacterium]